ncbi:fasciclin domain-containing protein [Aridibaculum aurantiacum]|uniref:fasciclin domain-containing protein n=1 Tax=Aridibaculum aurantiacum TaxID=2810307 RepID=UPI001A97CDAC|nr:fasciclin domain-containing protein [Aridibaculum aurantiacum]
MNLKIYFLPAVALSILVACNQGTETVESPTSIASAGAGQASVQDDDSQKDIVKIAVGSKEHTTLVKAVQAADLVNSLSNAGPFTVFAPVNAAFDKLPAGTVEGLLEPSKKADLQNVLEYHVGVGVLKTDLLVDGQSLGQVNGKNITISKKDGKIVVNGTANIIASIPASNGIIHVIDAVLLPPQ